MCEYEWRKCETGIAKTREQVPEGATIEAVSGILVICPCACCGQLILDGDRYATDRDEIFCEDCFKRKTLERSSR